MSRTILWLVRGFGILMIIVFGYMFCSMQQQLVDLQRTKREREALEGRPLVPPPTTTPEAEPKE